MKKIVFIILSLFVVSELSAQMVDVKADKLLKIISTRYKKFKSIKADFVYSIESKADKLHEKQKGTIIIKGNKFKLDIAGQIIICDNETVWTYNKEANEVQINKYNPKENAIRLDDIFTMYGKGFFYKMIEEKKESGKDISLVELTPKDKKKNFFKIKLTVDKTNQSIVKSTVYDKNGTIHEYTITNQVPNLKLEDHFFGFDVKKYPKVEVVDLRN
ncbi:MAG: outer membrane lipoprotein carrier protein LolA [Bacteroidota bacterium]